MLELGARIFWEKYMAAAKSKTLADRLHKWIGLVLFSFFFLQALTGFIIVDNERAMQMYSADLYVATKRLPAEQADIEKSFAALPKLQPGEAYASIFFPKKDDIPVMAIKMPAERAIPSLISIDPVKGTVMGSIPVLANPVILANLFHESLMAGQVGKIILAIFGIGLVILSITGVIRWWPGWGRFMQGLRMRRGKTLGQTLWLLHAPLGAITALFLFWMAGTGALLVGRAIFEPVVGTVAPIQYSVPLEESLPDSFLAVPDVIGPVAAAKIAQARFPNMRLTAVQPISKIAKHHAIVLMDAEKRASRVKIDGAGKIVATYVPETAPAASRMFDWMLPLHRGSMLPEAVRYLLYPLAVGFMLLALSGFVVNRSKASLAKQRIAKAKQ
jgi:uncharacterized iron-regulated membrane protein